MSVLEKGNPLGKVNEVIVKVLNTFSTWALAIMMFLTFVDVLLRYIFNSPIQGAAEIVEFMMAIVIPFSIVFCAQKKMHIGVDLVIENFSDFTRKVLESLSNLLMLVLFIPITWQSFIYVIDEFESNLTSPVLYIPVFPFVGMVALAFLVLTLILIEQFISSASEVLSRWIRS
ncbi:TRAP transporter small permease [bacterium]|nr:TRAP transporter small permease [bacterium]